jgi:hypothetical protein
VLVPTTTDPDSQTFMQGAFFGGFEVWACSLGYNLATLRARPLTPEIDAAFRAARERAVRVAADNLQRFAHVKAAAPAVIFGKEQRP